jgi:hypothetical protein
METDKVKTYNYKGQALTLRELSEAINIPLTTLKSRIKKHPDIPISQLTQPLNQNKSNGKKYTCNGKTMSILEWAEHFNLTYDVFRYRVVSRGIDEAVRLGSKKKIPRSFQTKDSLLDGIDIDPFDKDFPLKNLINSLKRLGYQGDQLKHEALKRCTTI